MVVLPAPIGPTRKMLRLPFIINVELFYLTKYKNQKPRHAIIPGFLVFGYGCLIFQAFFDNFRCYEN